MAREVTRRDGRRLVLDALAASGTVSRADLARLTGLAPSTVTTVVAGLLDSGLLADTPATTAGGIGAGRPAQLLSLHRKAGTVVGVDLGRTHLKVAVADLAHRVLSKVEVRKAVDHHASEDIALIQKHFSAVLDAADVRPDEVTAVGMGLPGPVHRSGGLGDSTILPGWVGVKAGEALSDALQMPVTVDNDANLGALGELTWGAGVGERNVVYLKLATGIGAGLVIDGHLYRGAGHTAGELGHTVIQPGGPVCRCGNRGCLEMYAGSVAIVDALRHTRGPEVDLPGVIELALAGDVGCQRVIADAGQSIGTALATLCNIVNPARIIVGGTLGAAADVLLDPMREAVSRGAVRSAAEDVEIVTAQLGDDAELLGAVVLALQIGGPQRV